MKLEEINLLEVESPDGFSEIINLEKVERVLLNINGGILEMKNGIIKLLNLKSAHKVYKWFHK